MSEDLLSDKSPGSYGSPVLPADMVGVWQGEGIRSGHPPDGVLETKLPSAASSLRHHGRTAEAAVTPGSDNGPSPQVAD